MIKLSRNILFIWLLTAGCAFAGDFEAPGDGTVIDRSTGLIWQQTENARMSWQAAMDRCEALSVGGRGDWRLPTKEELLTLVDSSRQDPATDIRFFPKTKSTAYWTGSRDKERVWGIGFSDGEEFIFGGTELALYVRCVTSDGAPAVQVAKAPKAPAQAPVPSVQAPAPPAGEVKAQRPHPPVAPEDRTPTGVSDQKNPSLPDPVQTVREWAGAWSAQQVENYLAFYGKEFVPSGKTGRSGWEDQRQRALTRPKWIKVELDDIRTFPLSDGRMQVEFIQHYRSDTYQDKVRKAIVLVPREDRWAILSEETTAVLK